MVTSLLMSIMLLEAFKMRHKRGGLVDSMGIEFSISAEAFLIVVLLLIFDLATFFAIGMARL